MTTKQDLLISKVIFEAVTIGLWAATAGAFVTVGTKAALLASGIMLSVVILKVFTIKRLMRGK